MLQNGITHAMTHSLHQRLTSMISWQLYWVSPSLVACADLAMADVAGGLLDFDEDDDGGEPKAAKDASKEKKQRSQQWIRDRTAFHVEHWGPFEERFADMYELMAHSTSNMPQDEDGLGSGSGHRVGTGVLSYCSAACKVAMWTVWVSNNM